jgi:hypothetical protein
MLKTLRASALLLALCCPAFGGDIPNPPAPQPPPPAPTNAVQEPEDGEILTPPTAQETTIQVALTLLQSALSLF